MMRALSLSGISKGGVSSSSESSEETSESSEESSESSDESASSEPTLSPETTAQHEPTPAINKIKRHLPISWWPENNIWEPKQSEL